MTSPPELTLLLGRIADGDLGAREKLVSITYDELKAIARSHLGRRGDTLRPTMLVHEAFLRLFGGESVRARDRREYFGLAAKVMRDLLVDQARARGALKRGGDRQRVTLSTAMGAPDEHVVDIFDLGVALDELRELDEGQHTLVELRFFAGLSMEEIAEQLEVSLSTVEREWRAARAWLAARLMNPES